MRKRDPRTKEELLDRMLSFDFDGDIRHLGVEPASVVRSGPNKLLLSFPNSGTTYELEVHRPREFSKAAAQSAPRAGEGRSFQRDDGLRRVEREPEPAPEVTATGRKRRKDAGQPRQRSA